MKLTEQQIKDTVNRARMSEQEKAALIQQAIGGDQGARFCVVALARRQAS